MVRPQIALSAFSASGVLVANGGFVDLQIGSGADFFAHGFVDHREHLCEAEHPVSHGLAADVDAVAGLVDLRLAVERKVVGIFASTMLASSPAEAEELSIIRLGAGATTGGSERSSLRTYFGRTVRRLKNFVGTTSSSSVTSSPMRLKASGSASTTAGSMMISSTGRSSRMRSLKGLYLRFFRGTTTSSISASASGVPGATKSTPNSKAS